jgi:hypothetical protein
MKRNSYDTAIKHLVRLGLVDAIPSELYALLSSSNISRWKNEDEPKYFGSGLNSEIKLLMRNTIYSIRLLNLKDYKET